jgi:20S proteasome alpha/beta subunit
MTICLATICNEGKYVIVMSDAMITGEHLSIEFEHKRPKITILANNCAVATAGDALAHTELFEAVKEEIDKLKKPKITEVVKCIKNCFVELRQRQIKERILNPRGIRRIEDFYQMQQTLAREVILTLQNTIDKYEFGLDVLVGGVDTNGAHIHSVIDPGTSVSFDSIGYHAIGSGYPHAVTSLIANDFNQDIPLTKALLITYEAKKIAERAPGVGANITNVAIISSKKAKLFNSNEVQEIDKVYKEKLKNELEWKREKEWEKELEKLTRNLK